MKNRILIRLFNFNQTSLIHKKMGSGERCRKDNLTEFSKIFDETTTILIKTSLIMTLLIILISATLHICCIFIVMSKVI